MRKLLNSYQLRINLERISPPIWRRFTIPQDCSLADLHQVIQTVIGWGDYHLHLFEIGGKEYSSGELDSNGDGVIEETEALLSSVLKGNVKQFRYTYDFGDNWIHTLTVEGMVNSESKSPKVLAGKRCGPPEDCGGPWGYQRLLSALAETNNPQHAKLLEVYGEDFDPDHFDVDEINAILEKEWTSGSC